MLKYQYKYSSWCIAKLEYKTDLRQEHARFINFLSHMFNQNIIPIT